MDIIQLYQDYSVHYLTEGHKHCRPGWVNTPCPFCSSPAGHEGYHLGYNIRGNYYVCWRCGWHTVSESLVLLTGLSYRQVKDIVRKYGILIPSLEKEIEVDRNKIDFKLPTGLTELNQQHMRYLERIRKFDPDLIARLWDIRSTGPVSSMMIQRKGRDVRLNYAHRMFIPYYWNTKIVTFDTRIVTSDNRDAGDKSFTKYYACPDEQELIPHKSILYCRQEALLDRAIIVEGPTDAWRFGPENSAAVSGINFMPTQVRVIAKMFKRAPVCFDGGEPQAKKQADKLVSELKLRNVDSFRVDIEGDPGSMDQAEADYLVKQLIK